MCNSSLRRQCDHPTCVQEGGYRAPRSRACDTYYWFCLDHVRDYNQSWDFCKDMTLVEIEDHLRNDIVWRRPTWPLGTRGSWLQENLVRDSFRLFEHKQNSSFPSQQIVTKNIEVQAMRAMELHYPVTRANVKTRYKELVKRLHPDIHGGDKATEEKLKTVIEAYKTLMSRLNN